VNGVLVAVAVALLAAFAAVGILTGDEEAEQAGGARGASLEQAGGARGASLEQVAERLEEVARDVERARELEFDRLPRVRLVSLDESIRDSLRELDHYISRRRQRIEERLLVMLGLLPPGTRLRELVGKALGEEVAGYYIPRTETMALVRGAALGGLFAEVTLAHELTHALEDQHFGLEVESNLFLRDRGLAHTALHEGSATVVMVDYVAMTQGLGEDLPAGLRRSVLEELEGAALPVSSGLPRYVRESLVFPYVAGGRFVARVQARGGWGAVDRAFGEDGPVSTEQVMHPEKYEAGERPVRVRLRGHRAELPEGARVVARGDVGEFDTAQILRDANGRRRSEEAAEGWGGSAFELWRLPAGEDVLVMAWAWDTPRDAAEFAAAARSSVERLGGAGAVNDSSRGVAVVLAPEASLARRVARRTRH
jgi:hypothetical protein